MSRHARSNESPISPSNRSSLSRNSSFTQDASRKPSGPRPGPRRTASIASSTHSLSTARETTAPPAGIPEASDNAISTLLQNPIVRTGWTPQPGAPSSLRFPTSRDIPPVTLTGIPPIDESVFRSYLSQAGGLYDGFRRSKEEADEPNRLGPAPASSAEDMAGEGLGPRMHRRLSSASTVTMAESGPPGESTSGHHRRRSSTGAPRRNPLAVAPLSTIPSVYFDPDFRLENPRTFDVVSERSEIAPRTEGPLSPSPDGSGKKALAANAILQEKLSWYMDTVEIHLISSISTASTSFFAALGSLRGLQDEARESVEKIRLLRKDLTDLDRGMAVGGLEIIAKKRRRENLRRLTDAVQQLEFVTRCIGECEEQVDIGEVDNALTGLADIEHVIAGEKPPPQRSRVKQSSSIPGPLVNLRGIKALDGITDDIALLRKRIGKAYEAKFMEVLLQDLKAHVDKVATSSTLARLERASSHMYGRHQRTPSEMPAYLSVEEGFRSTLRAQLKGLGKSDATMTAAVAYREVILKEFKNLIRRHLPSSSDDDIESTTSIATHDSRARSAQEKSTILARNLRALDAEDAIEMLTKIYCNVSEGLRRLGNQVKVLLDITSSLENPPPIGSPSIGSPNLGSPNLSALRSPPWSPQNQGSLSIDDRLAAIKSPRTPPIPIRHEEISQALDLSNLLGQAVDIAQAQVNKILRVRVEQTTRMQLRPFLRYYNLNRLFADECEAVSGRGGTALRTVVNEQIIAHVNFVAETERSKLIQKMDADKWDARDFSEEPSERLQRIIRASTSDIEDWTKIGSILEDFVSPNATPNGTSTEKPADATSSSSVRSAVIDEEKYILPESAMVVMAGIESFEKHLAGIPKMSTEICSLLLDYIKLFNSRSSQLILGAGATRSAGLKNITTKHLSLSSQGLSFVVAIIPYVREFARRCLPASSALLGEFDKVKRLLQEHQSGIHDKLVEIMTGRATAHVHSMKKIDWDAPKASDGVSPYMETLMKETSILHRVLIRHLPDSSVSMIMQPVLAGYQDQWTRAFSNAAVKTAAGKERLVRDAEFFRTRISRIDGGASIGESVYTIASKRTVQQETSPEESAPKAEVRASTETTKAES